MAFYFRGGYIYHLAVFMALCAKYVLFMVHNISFCGGVALCGVVRSFINAKLMIGGGGIFCPQIIWCKSLFLKKFF